MSASSVQKNGNCIKMDNDDISFNYDEDSISSEEDMATQLDFEERVRVRRVQEIWNGDEVREVLMSLPDAEGITEWLVNNENENMVFETKHLESLLLLAAWYGNENGVKFALEHGQDPNVLDPEGRYKKVIILLGLIL